MVPGVILYAGRDQALLQTRRLILQEQGYVVEVCDNTEEFVGKFLDGDFDLVLLCNSLRDGERERLCSLVHRFSQRTPVLVVRSLPEHTSHSAEYACTGEPQTILAGISRLIAAPSVRKPARGAAADAADAQPQPRTRP